MKDEKSDNPENLTPHEATSLLGSSKKISFKLCCGELSVEFDLDCKYYPVLLDDELRQENSQTCELADDYLINASED
nr:hypothetical protein Iba_chr04dCG17000 [Ipomoea batatas]